MIVSKWSPKEDDSEAKVIPLWVHLKGVPMSMYSWEGLSFITSTAGKPDRLHPETVACTNFEEAKVFVFSDQIKELPTRITYMIEGVETTVDFTYPSLPPKYISCGRWGHFETFCKAKMVAEQKIQVPENIIQSPEEVLDDGIKDNVEFEKEEGEIMEVNENVEKSCMGEQDVIGVVEEKRNTKVGKKIEKSSKGEECTNEWKRVSGEKAGRSPKSQNLQFGQVQIATPSRFAALSNTEETENEEELEKEMSESEDMRSEEAEDVYQSKMEESIEGKQSESRKGRAWQNLARLSKTRHKVVQERVLRKN